MSLLYGDKFKDYEIIKEIGSGGFGSVYMVNIYNHGEKMTGALKILHSSHLEDDKLVHRFHREARLASRIDCKWTPKIIDHGEFEGEHFILMEFAEGINLKEFQNSGIIPEESAIFQDTTINNSSDETIMLDNQDEENTSTKTIVLSDVKPEPSPPYVGGEKEALTIIKQCAEVLHKSDEQKLIHRDIKPANILIRRNKKGEIESKLIDFGLAKCFIDNTLNISLQGQTMGTPAYMSPEQIRGEQPDIRSDIYSLGMTIYTFVTGRLPFKGDGPKEYLEQVMSARLVNPKKYNKKLSDNFISLLRRLTERDNQKRIQKPNEIISAVNDILSGNVKVIKKNNNFKKLISCVIFLLITVLSSILFLKKQNKITENIKSSGEQKSPLVEENKMQVIEKKSQSLYLDETDSKTEDLIEAGKIKDTQSVKTEQVIEKKTNNVHLYTTTEEKTEPEKKKEIILSRSEREKLLLKKREELFRKNSKKQL